MNDNRASYQVDPRAAGLETPQEDATRRIIVEPAHNFAAVHACAGERSELDTER